MPDHQLKTPLGQEAAKHVGTEQAARIEEAARNGTLTVQIHENRDGTVSTTLDLGDDTYINLPKPMIYPSQEYDPDSEPDAPPTADVDPEPEPDLESQIDETNSEQDPNDCNFWCQAGQYLEAAAKQMDTIYERIKNTEVDWEDVKAVGHGALDVVGFFPVVGDIADAANALWLTAEDDYEGAAFTLLGIAIPFVGDVIGKLLKLLRSNSAASIALALEMIRQLGGTDRVREILSAFPNVLRRFDELYRDGLERLGSLIEKGQGKLDDFKEILGVAKRDAQKAIAKRFPSREIVLESSRRPAKAGSSSSRAMQAIQKKVDRGDAAYRGMSKTQEQAEELIKGIYDAPGKIFREGVNRNGQQYMEVFDPTTGRGIRVLSGSNQFDTFVNF